MLPCSRQWRHPQFFDLLLRRVYAWNVSCWISLCWPNYLINSFNSFPLPTDAAALRKKETNPLSQNLIFYIGNEFWYKTKILNGAYCFSFDLYKIMLFIKKEKLLFPTGLEPATFRVWGVKAFLGKTSVSHWLTFWMWWIEEVTCVVLNL